MRLCSLLHSHKRTIMDTSAFHLCVCGVRSLRAAILGLPRRRAPGLTSGGGKIVEIPKCGQRSPHDQLISVCLPATWSHTWSAALSSSLLFSTAKLGRKTMGVSKLSPVNESCSCNHLSSCIWSQQQQQRWLNRPSFWEVMCCCWDLGHIRLSQTSAADLPQFP